MGREIIKYQWKKGKVGEKIWEERNCKEVKIIVKQKFLKNVILGWYLKKIGSISIKRNKVTKDNLGFFEEITNQIKNSDRPVIIFPQGTRVLPNERPPFKKGVARIYEELKITCQPIAINSGYVWPKNG